MMPCFFVINYFEASLCDFRDVACVVNLPLGTFRWINVLYLPLFFFLKIASSLGCWMAWQGFAGGNVTGTNRLRL